MRKVVARLKTGVDPRFIIFSLLLLFLCLGFTVLGFNRSPTQALLTTFYCVVFELLFRKWFGKPFVFPLSAMITSLSLSILLDYPHQYHLLILPPLLAIGSKFILTLNGRHFFNPALIGVTLSVLLFGDHIGLAPAFQWNGFAYISLLLLVTGTLFLLPKINRHWLVISFASTYAVATLLRGFVFQAHIPFETIFVGALTTPSFFLFSLFMMTDPQTSPPGRRDQILVGCSIALLDFVFHLFWSYHTLFYAAASVGLLRFVWFHGKALLARRHKIFEARFSLSLRYSVAAATLIASLAVYDQVVLAAGTRIASLDYLLRMVPSYHTQIQPRDYDVVQDVDPRLQHVGKWLLSSSENVAAADLDGDGDQDLFFVNSHKAPDDRLMLFKNLGAFRFERIRPAALESLAKPRERGLPTYSLFVDFDSDGDQDMYIGFMAGRPLLLKNLLKETGQATFVDVTKDFGVDVYQNSLSAVFSDFNRDGRLDLLVTNVLVQRYEWIEGAPLFNMFALPPAASPSDTRALQVMPESWSAANNGGTKQLFIQNSSGRFELQNNASWGLEDQRFGMAVGSADLNQDGWQDLYIANDYGPDELYMNEKGVRFSAVKGGMFGEIGRDTYKGMNVTLADFDSNGFLDVYVSNIHLPLLTEGSLLWMFDERSARNPLRLRDKASRMGVANEGGHGWGASATDLNNDGWLELVQTNGMLHDDSLLPGQPCVDIYYLFANLVRAPSSIHRNAAYWESMRGACLANNQPVRVWQSNRKTEDLEFDEVTHLSGVDLRFNTRGVGSIDLDNDGRRDLVITGINTPPVLYRNEASPTATKQNHWIGFELVGDGSVCNRDAVGTYVKIVEPSSQSPQLTAMQISNGYAAQEDRRLHFGLGDFSGDVTVEINWCGVRREVKSQLKVDRYHRLELH